MKYPAEYAEFLRIVLNLSDVPEELHEQYKQELSRKNLLMPPARFDQIIDAGIAQGYSIEYMMQHTTAALTLYARDTNETAYTLQ